MALREKDIKLKVAEHVQLAVASALNEARLYMSEERETLEVEVSTTDWLNTQVRVKTVRNGIHYYNVKVSGS